ncbi:MAG: putative 2-dehydropantoate 2-reductase [Desulfosudaceae bacterium]
MKYGVIGTGAVGGYYGGLLCRHGLDTHFLLHSDYDHVAAEGLRVDSRDGDFHLTGINIYRRPEDMPRCDVVLVALKTTANDALVSILPPVTKAGGVVIMLQNGLGVEAAAAELVPAATIIGGLCFLCSNKVGPGHIRHLDFGSVRLGEYSPNGGAAGITPTLQAVADTFAAAGISVDVTADLGLARWQKLVWNMAFNGTAVVLGATTDQLMADPDSLALVRNIMTEVTAAARACGHDLGDGFIDIMLAATREMVAYSPSMKLDYEAGRPLEIEGIYRRPIAAARKAGVEMLRAAAVADELSFLDKRNRQ